MERKFRSNHEFVRPEKKFNEFQTNVFIVRPSVHDGINGGYCHRFALIFHWFHFIVHFIDSNLLGVKKIKFVGSCVSSFFFLIFLYHYCSFWRDRLRWVINAGWAACFHRNRNQTKINQNLNGRFSRTDTKTTNKYQSYYSKNIQAKIEFIVLQSMDVNQWFWFDAWLQKY